jgi:hypothetical protein
MEEAVVTDLHRSLEGQKHGRILQKLREKKRELR